MTKINFLGNLISPGYVKTISQDTTTAFAFDVTQTYSISCKDKSEQGLDGVGLWQWVTSSHDLLT